MKNFICVLSLFIVLWSCNDKKEYKYIEVYEDTVGVSRQIKEKEAESIHSDNDSTAYFYGLTHFCVAAKVVKDMKDAGMTTFRTPLRFKLFNAKQEDITTIWAGLYKIHEDSIKKMISSMPNDVKSSTSTAKTVAVDSSKLNLLKQYFRVKKDEFSKDNRIIYKPKNAPDYINRNGVYCYFSTANDNTSNLKFCVQYYAEDWLFFNQIQFSIDGKAYEYTPTKTETDHGDGHIWEWFDDGMTTEADKELINALANAKSAKMKIIGRQYYKVKEITSEQILGIKRTLEFYNAKGGAF